MATYTFDLALVKYAKESLDEYATFMPFKILNSKDKTFYAKISIVSQGNLLWSFVDDAGVATTSKTYTLNANSVLSLNEKLLATTAPIETQKDSISVKIEYFKNSDLTGKFGEDSITVNIHCYVQNVDGTWTSTAYTNEADIIYEYWNFAGLPSTSIGNGTRLTGVNGVADIYFTFARYGGYGLHYVSDTGLVSDASLKIDVFAGANAWVNLYTHFVLAGTTDAIYDKFLAVVINIIQSHGNIVVAYTTNTNDNDMSRNFLSFTSGIKKAVAIPFAQFTQALYQRSGGYNVHTIAKYDGLYLFNKLP